MAMTDTKDYVPVEVQRGEEKGDIQIAEIDRTVSPELAMRGGALQDTEDRGQQESGYI